MSERNIFEDCNNPLMKTLVATIKSDKSYHKLPYNIKKDVTEFYKNMFSLNFVLSNAIFILMSEKCRFEYVSKKNRKFIENSKPLIINILLNMFDYAFKTSDIGIMTKLKGNKIKKMFKSFVLDLNECGFHNFSSLWHSIYFNDFNDFLFGNKVIINENDLKKIINRFDEITHKSDCRAFITLDEEDIRKVYKNAIDGK